jgi:hypothetical protein
MLMQPAYKTSHVSPADRNVSSGLIQPKQLYIRRYFRLVFTRTTFFVNPETEALSEGIVFLTLTPTVVSRILCILQN